MKCRCTPKEVGVEIAVVMSSLKRHRQASSAVFGSRTGDPPPDRHLNYLSRYDAAWPAVQASNAAERCDGVDTGSPRRRQCSRGRRRCARIKEAVTCAWSTNLSRNTGLRSPERFFPKSSGNIPPRLPHDPPGLESRVWHSWRTILITGIKDDEISEHVATA